MITEESTTQTVLRIQKSAGIVGNNELYCALSKLLEYRSKISQDILVCRTEIGLIDLQKLYDKSDQLLKDLLNLL